MCSSCEIGSRMRSGTHLSTGGSVFPFTGDIRKRCNSPTKKRNCSCRASGSPRHCRFPMLNCTRNSVFFSSTFPFEYFKKLASGLKWCGSGHRSVCRCTAYKFVNISESFGMMYSRTRVSLSAQWIIPSGTMDTKRCTSYRNASVNWRRRRSEYWGSLSRPICSTISERTLSWMSG